MNRFEDTLQRSLRQIADRATPSPDAWTQIQSRIDDQDPIQETEIIMLTDNTLTTRRWPLVAAAAAVAALAITGISLVNRGDDQSPADVPEPTPTVAPEIDESGNGEATADEQIADAISPLPSEGQALPPGRYAPFTLGFSVEFDVPTATASPWTVQVSNPVTINVGNDDGFVVFTRVGSLYDSAQAQTPDMTGLGSIPPDDIDGWIAANDVVVVDSREEMIDGRTARFRQVTAPPGAGDATESCSPELRPCLSLASASADLQDTYDGVSMAVFGDNPHLFWFVELDDFEPLAIWVSAVGADSDDWLAEVQPLIDSISLGDPAPATEFGRALLSTFDPGTDASSGLPAAGVQLEQGSYSSDALGVPVTFDVREGAAGPFTVTSHQPGAIELGVEGGPAVEYVGILRIGSFYDTIEANDPATTGLGSIPADDIDGWIASNEMTVVESAEVSISSRSAKLRRVILDSLPTGTGWGFSRSADVESGPEAVQIFAGSWTNSAWLVDMGEYEPILIFAATDGADQQQWMDEIAQPIIDSITFGEPAPTVEGGTARVPERVTVSAPFTGVRTDGDLLPNGSTSITYAATSEGPVAGEIIGTGWAIPGNPTVGHDENVFTGTIEGVGTGTLSWTVDWTGTNPDDLVSTEIITGGTGDFTGATGTVSLKLESSNNVGGVDTVTGTNTFELVIPRSG